MPLYSVRRRLAARNKLILRLLYPHPQYILKGSLKDQGRGLGAADLELLSERSLLIGGLTAGL